MSPKISTWYQTDLDFNATKNRLLSATYKSRIIGDSRHYRGRLHFSLKDYKSITFQVTTKGKLGIYHPKEITIQKCLKLVKPILVRVDHSTVEVFTKIKESSDIHVKDKTLPRKRSRSKATLKHSRNLFLTTKYKQGYDAIMPHMVIDKLAFLDLEDVDVKMKVDMDDRCVLQHLESGYEAVYSALLEYRRLMDETGLSKVKGFPKFRISRTPFPKGGPYPVFLPHGPIQELKIPSLSEYLDSEEVNPEVAKRYRLPLDVSKEKIKKLLNLWDFLYFQICKILRHVEHGSPLLGSCEDCPL